MYGGGPYDVEESDILNECSALLSVRHCSHAAGPVAWPTTGVLYGPYKRPVVCLPVALDSGSFKNVVFLVDTGAAVTELTFHAYASLCLLPLADAGVPPAARANINGRRVNLHVRPAAAAVGSRLDIPVLGADALAALGVELRINYASGVVTLQDAKTR